MKQFQHIALILTVLLSLTALPILAQSTDNSGKSSSPWGISAGIGIGSRFAYPAKPGVSVEFGTDRMTLTGAVGLQTFNNTVTSEGTSEPGYKSLGKTLPWALTLSFYLIPATEVINLRVGVGYGYMANYTFDYKEGSIAGADTAWTNHVIQTGVLRGASILAGVNFRFFAGLGAEFDLGAFLPTNPPERPLFAKDNAWKSVYPTASIGLNYRIPL